jgi:hypothetical protein
MAPTKDGARAMIRMVFFAIIVILVVIQFVPVSWFVSVDPSMAPDPLQFGAPAEVKAVMQRSCYDCHSNQTRWPWYARIAPVSLLLARDVSGGRKELNFSIWDQYEPRRKSRKLKEIVEQVEKGDMPPWYYVPLHPDAKLSAADRETIVNWAKRQ